MEKKNVLKLETFPGTCLLFNIIVEMVSDLELQNSTEKGNF